MLEFDLNKSGAKTPKLEVLRNADGELLHKGRVLAFMVAVAIVEYNHKEGEFAGRKVPALRFTFDNFREPEEALRQTLDDVKIPGRLANENGAYANRKPEDVVKNLTENFEKIKHFYDSFNSSVNYKNLAAYPKEVISAALNINYEGTVDEYVESWTKFVTFFSEAFNKAKNDKAVFVDAKGKPVLLWVRLVREYQYGKSYTLPRWVQGGIIEVARVNATGVIYESTLPFEDPADLKLKFKADKSTPGMGGPGMPHVSAPGQPTPPAQSGAMSPMLASILNKVQNKAE